MTALNRRGFLQALVAFGATLTLPDSASPAQVDTAWLQAQETPWFFEINDSHTIVDPLTKAPEVWNDIYDINLEWIKTPDDLIDEVMRCVPLQQVFLDEAQDKANELRHSLDETDLSTKARKALVHQIEALEDEDDGWASFIESEGNTGLDQLKDLLADWLTDDIDWQYQEHFDDFGGQGAAKHFFESLGAPTCRKLGVVIIEGEHPGSTYYAAELRGDIGSANQAAKTLGLPIRFRQEAVT